MAVIANVALTNTFDTWRIRTNDTLARLNQFTVSNSAIYANTVTANVALNALGTATVTGLFTASGRATVGTNLTVSGNTTLGAASKTITTTGLIDHTGRAAISTNLAVTGNTSTNKLVVTSSVTGTAANATFNKTTISSSLVSSGNASFSGTTTDNSNALSQTLSDGATISWDVSSGRVATVTLGGSRTMAAPTNLKVGTYILKVIQDGVGSHTLTWNSVFKWTAGVAPTLSTAASSVDIFSFFSDGTNLYGSFLPDMQ